MNSEPEKLSVEKPPSKGALDFGTFVQKRYWPAIGPELHSDWRKTVEHYHLPVLIRAFGALQLNDIEPEDVQVWWGQLRAGASSPATCNKLLTRLKHILSKAVEWQYITQNPARFLKRARESRGRVRFFSDEQRRLLIEKANPNLQLYIVAAAYTGGRRRSLLNLKERDVDWERGEITFRDTKNGEDHRVPLHPTLRAVLEPRRTGRDNANILPHYQPAALSRAFKRLTLRLGLDNYRFHDIRHDVASRLALSGANQRMIMEVLGHKDPRASVRYTHLNQASVRGAMLGALT
jgi:integrase